MRLHNLKINKGSKKRKRRLGRGSSSGHGIRCGKGTKGQKKRSGYKKKPGFEGGQMSILRKAPKVGMSRGTKQNRMRHEKTVYKTFNTSFFNRFDEETTVSEEFLLQEGFIKPADFGKIKVLSDKKLEKKVDFSGEIKFSASAKKEVEEKGGTIKE